MDFLRLSKIRPAICMTSAGNNAGMKNAAGLTRVWPMLLLYEFPL